MAPVSTPLQALSAKRNGNTVSDIFPAIFDEILNIAEGARWDQTRGFDVSPPLSHATGRNVRYRKWRKPEKILEAWRAYTACSDGCVPMMGDAVLYASSE